MEEQTEIPGLYRDLETGALISRDNIALNAYKNKRNRFINNDIRLNDIESRLDDLTSSMQDIKTLLITLIEK